MIDKNTFGSKELPSIIAQRLEKEKELVITIVGVCTDICVISNALLLKAFFPEAVITVDAHCCAGVTTKSHMNALQAMEMCQIQIINK